MCRLMTPCLSYMSEQSCEIAAITGMAVTQEVYDKFTATLIFWCCFVIDTAFESKSVVDVRVSKAYYFSPVCTGMMILSLSLSTYHFYIPLP